MLQQQLPSLGRFIFWRKSEAEFLTNAFLMSGSVLHYIPAQNIRFSPRDASCVLPPHRNSKTVRNTPPAFTPTSHPTSPLKFPPPSPLSTPSSPAPLQPPGLHHSLHLLLLPFLTALQISPVPPAAAPALSTPVLPLHSQLAILAFEARARSTTSQPQRRHAR